MMSQKQVVEYEAQMLPEVEVAKVERGNQEVAAEEELTADVEVGQEISDSKEGDEEEQFPQVDEEAQWVTAITRYGRSSRLLERYWQEMNAAAIVVWASKNYYALLYKEEEDQE